MKIFLKPLKNPKFLAIILLTSIILSAIVTYFDIGEIRARHKKKEITDKSVETNKTFQETNNWPHFQDYE